MPNVMVIQGKVETIWDNEDFARMLRDRLGDDAERYFRDACNPDVFLTGIDSVREYCVGECEETQRIQEHYERILHDVQDELDSWDFDSATKLQLRTKRAVLWNKINSEL